MIKRFGHLNFLLINQGALVSTQTTAQLNSSIRYGDVFCYKIFI